MAYLYRRDREAGKEGEIVTKLHVFESLQKPCLPGGFQSSTRCDRAPHGTVTASRGGLGAGAHGVGGEGGSNCSRHDGKVCNLQGM